jgi:RNA polymerase sigma-70 factor (sigma-E family)
MPNDEFARSMTSPGSVNPDRDGGNWNDVAIVGTSNQKPDRDQPRRTTGAETTRAQTYSAMIGRDLLGLCRLAFLLCGNPADAEDLVAEAYARAWMPWIAGTVDDLGPYVRRILVNLNLDRSRRRSLTRKHEAEQIERAIALDPQDDVNRHLDLVRGLKALPQKQRTVIVLRYYADMSEGEVANLLGIAVGTVKSRASRAVKTLGRFVDGGDDA